MMYKWSLVFIWGVIDEQLNPVCILWVNGVQMDFSLYNYSGLRRFIHLGPNKIP